jgi:hypothetical protein
MLRSTLPVVLLIVAVAGCATAAPRGTAGAARPVVIGIGDPTPSMFADPRFSRLGIRTARDVVPWDIVTRQADAPDLAGRESDPADFVRS